MEDNYKTKEANDATRHCAYCLQLCGLPAKICGGCKKRAYCSKECQEADWSSKGNGQRHVKWCRRHECGEEDVEWEVVPIPNKGLGIRAKKFIPSGMKIIVEPSFFSPNDHPGIKDLGPEGDTLEQKFSKNPLMGANVEVLNGEVLNSVALRIARVNHACQPNASIMWDDTARVAILFALNDVKPGEEISISYYSPFFSLLPNVQYLPGMKPEWNVEEEFTFIKKHLLSTFGITCPTDCPCHDPGIRILIQEGRQLTTTMMNLHRQHKTEEALAAGEKVLDIHRRLNVSWTYLAIMGVNLFLIASSRSETFPRAKEYILSTVELFKKMCPYSEKRTKAYEKLLEYPETTDEFLSDTIERLRIAKGNSGNE